MLICEVAFKVRKFIILLLVDSLFWYILNDSSATWHRWMTLTEILYLFFINPQVSSYLLEYLPQNGSSQTS